MTKTRKYRCVKETIARMRPELRFSILLAEDVSEKLAKRRRGEARLARALGLRHYRARFLYKKLYSPWLDGNLGCPSVPR